MIISIIQKYKKNTKFVKRHVAVASEANTTMSVQFGSSLSQRPIFIFSVAEVTSDYLTTDGLKKFFSTSGVAR